MKTYQTPLFCAVILCALIISALPRGAYAFAPVATPISETLPVSPTIEPIPEPEPMLYDIPQRIEVIDKDTFMILPKEAPFPTGTISGPMFSDSIEVVGKEPAFVRKMEQTGWQTQAPTPPEPPTAPEVPHVSKIRDNAVATAGLNNSNNTSATTLVKKGTRVDGAASPKKTRAKVPPQQAKATVAKAPTAKPIPHTTHAEAGALKSATLELPFMADSTMIDAEMREKFAAFSAPIAHKTIKNINVIGYTIAPPLADAKSISQARWRAIKLMLEEANSSAKSAALSTVFFSTNTQQRITVNIEYQ